MRDAMVDLPWQSVHAANHQRQYLALLSYLPLRGYRKMWMFSRHVRAIRRQLARTPGLIGYSLRAKLFRHRFWTLSVWEDNAALTAFVRKNSERFWTHSKYDTVTPPPFARMSGIRRIPRLWKRSSASGVVGPFAPSAMIFAFTRGAFSDVRTPSRAHGARIVTSSSRSASFVTSFVPGKPTTLPVRSLNARTSFGSNPLSLKMPPFESETATIRAPCSSCMSRA